MRALLTSSATALVLAVTLLPARAAAQGTTPRGATGEIVGVTRDGAGYPVSTVEVTLPGFRVMSDSLGRFRVLGVPVGGATLRARRIGYRTASTPIEVRAGEAATATIALTAIPQELNPVVVSAPMRPSTRRMKEFYDRRQRGSGYFLAREQLEPHDRSRLTDALRSRVPAAQVSSVGGRTRLRLRGGRCAPLVWLDGASTPSGEFDIDAIPTNTVAAIEIYPGPATVPAQFRSPGGGRDSCGGAVVIWSRMDYVEEERAARPRKRTAREDSISATVPVYHANEVDQAAAVDSARLEAPVYPDSLAAFSVTGTVVAEFVIDTTGVPLPESIGIVNATHPALAASVRRAVAASRFVPARKGGRPVRQVMLLPYRFAGLTQP